MPNISEELSTNTKRILIFDDETAIFFAYQKLFRALDSPFIDVDSDVCRHSWHDPNTEAA